MSAAWLLIVVSIAGSVAFGVLAWDVGLRRGGRDAERRAYVGRMSGLAARLLAVALGFWLSGPRLVSATGWRRAPTLGMVAAIAAVLVGVAVPLVRGFFKDAPRPSSPGRWRHALWAVTAGAVPWLIVGLVAATTDSVGLRLLAVALATVGAFGSLWFVAPWMFVHTLTEPAPPHLEAIVANLYERYHQPSYPIRLIAFEARPCAWAAAVGRSPRGWIVLSNDLVDQLPQPLLEAIILHELGHHHARQRQRKAVPNYVATLAYLFGFLAFAAGALATLPAVVIALTGVFGTAARLRSEFAADAFAAQLCGGADLEAALTLASQINGARTDVAAPNYAGATHPTLAARIARLCSQGGAAEESAAVSA